MAETKVLSEISGSVWKILVKPGDKVEEEQPIAILESMKMEIPVLAPEGGIIIEIKVSEGNPVSEGELIATMST
jgi:biotin carboxyl carrier protein